MFFRFVLATIWQQPNSNSSNRVLATSRSVKRGSRRRGSLRRFRPRRVARRHISYVLCPGQRSGAPTCQVLQPRTLTHQLFPPGHLPVQREGLPVRHTQTSGRKPHAESVPRTVASIASVFTFAFAITRTCFGLAITTRSPYGDRSSATAPALPIDVFCPDLQTAQSEG